MLFTVKFDFKNLALLTCFQYDLVINQKWLTFYWATMYTGWPKKSKPLPNYQEIVLKPANEIRFIRQIKV